MQHNMLGRWCENTLQYFTLKWLPQIVSDLKSIYCNCYYDVVTFKKCNFVAYKDG